MTAPRRSGSASRTIASRSAIDQVQLAVDLREVEDRAHRRARGQRQRAALSPELGGAVQQERETGAVHEGDAQQIEHDLGRGDAVEMVVQRPDAREVEGAADGDPGAPGIVFLLDAEFLRLHTWNYTSREMTPWTVERAYAPTADSIAEAREIADEVRPPLGPRDTFALRLLLSELVTNAIRHGRTTPDAPEVKVRLVRDEQTLRLEVEDAGGGFVVRPRTPNQHRGSGWGMHFVSKLARRWGVEGHGRTLVWVELELDEAGELVLPAGEPDLLPDA
ncbi:hypothetical protein C7Y72_10110 [Paraconexibacter algicola]|uniref:Histidine kinase/HSP90-like ATPase domain-containing protein n=2 Tax=Thermoleophilia TaxID=1497346 RepID=A0A2T4UL56_9ACTN|nr:hypothetical protein C7Y72_10110 [Paraconexibacter algicola]